MVKFFYTFLLVVFINGCSSTSPMLNTQNNFKLPFGNNKYIEFDTAFNEIQHTFDTCVLDSYILKHNSNEYPNIYVEHITLKSNCSYRGLADGFFMDQFKENEKLQSLKKTKEIKADHYVISHYIVDEKFELFEILLWDASSDTIILDPTGTLANAILKKLNLNETLPLVSSPYNLKKTTSLVKENYFKNYFKAESSGSLLQITLNLNLN